MSLASAPVLWRVRSSGCGCCGPPELFVLAGARGWCVLVSGDAQGWCRSLGWVRSDIGGTLHV